VEPGAESKKAGGEDQTGCRRHEIEPGAGEGKKRKGAHPAGPSLIGLGIEFLEGKPEEERETEQ